MGKLKMKLDSADKAFISKLKSKLTKVLSVRSKLPKTESSSLERVYKLMDKLILQDEELSDIDVLRDSLSNEYGIIEGTRKRYIKEQILPLISVAVTREWGASK